MTTTSPTEPDDKALAEAIRQARAAVKQSEHNARVAETAARKRRERARQDERHLECLLLMQQGQLPLFTEETHE